MQPNTYCSMYANSPFFKQNKHWWSKTWKANFKRKGNILQTTSKFMSNLRRKTKSKLACLTAYNRKGNSWNRIYLLNSWCVFFENSSRRKFENCSFQIGKSKGAKHPKYIHKDTLIISPSAIISYQIAWLDDLKIYSGRLSTTKFRILFKLFNNDVGGAFKKQ